MTSAELPIYNENDGVKVYIGNCKKESKNLGVIISFLEDF